MLSSFIVVEFQLLSSSDGCRASSSCRLQIVVNFQLLSKSNSSRLSIAVEIQFLPTFNRCRHRIVLIFQSLSSSTGDVRCQPASNFDCLQLRSLRCGCPCCVGVFAVHDVNNTRRSSNRWQPPRLISHQIKRTNVRSRHALVHATAAPEITDRCSESTCQQDFEDRPETELKSCPIRLPIAK